LFDDTKASTAFYLNFTEICMYVLKRKPFYIDLRIVTFGTPYNIFIISYQSNNDVLFRISAQNLFQNTRL